MRQHIKEVAIDGKGKVKWFHRKKGFGLKFLDDGEEVEFDLEKDDKGLKAKNVSRGKK